MIAGGSVTVLVADVSRAVRFYVETLGFKLREGGSETRADVDAGDGLVIGLARNVSVGARAGIEGSSIELRLNQPIADVVAVLSNRGVAFRGAVEEEAETKRASFVDPDGNVLALVERTPTAGSRSSVRG